MFRLDPDAVLRAAAGGLAFTAGMYTWRWWWAGSAWHATLALVHWAMGAFLLWCAWRRRRG
jgi:hypothetical protein